MQASLAIVPAAGSGGVTLNELAERAAPRSLIAGYSGEVTPLEAWNYLASHEASALVDVRTQPEWQFVGQPDLRAALGAHHAVSWKMYPTFAENPDFAAALSALQPDRDMPLFFLCRSGGRSLDAAIAMTALGYRYCFNIEGGFEGEPDVARHRGVRGGWKFAGLPWTQA